MSKLQLFEMKWYGKYQGFAKLVATTLINPEGDSKSAHNFEFLVTIDLQIEVLGRGAVIEGDDVACERNKNYIFLNWGIELVGYVAVCEL